MDDSPRLIFHTDKGDKWKSAEAPLSTPSRGNSTAKITADARLLAVAAGIWPRGRRR